MSRRADSEEGASIDETLPASAPVSGDDATVAPPLDDANAATVAPEAARANEGSLDPAPVIVRRGGAGDYRELIAVDPAHYVMGGEIARGGMGRILEAHDRRLGRQVAIKELLYDTGDLRARFEREARITARLQHPAIVHVLEAGTWPSGEPFYVMKLVAGESLDKVIAARATLAERLALLPHVIAAVDALAYAHSRKVIHRDLKPANILIGEFGETVVIDWGLAKDLADGAGHGEVAIGPQRPTPGETRETIAGSVMGTPAYMPAEQARGDAVDERADVHALGAMLYHLLAGAPPYTGKTTELILDAVIAGPPPPLATRAAGIPPDLIAIVEKAMAHHPADRYPTAQGLADDLKKFSTGQLVGAHHYSLRQLLSRWLRRYRAPVMVAAAACVILAVVGVVSVRRILREHRDAEAQRALAIQNRGEAEVLMTFMLGDLRDKLHPLGKLDLLDSVARRAVDYYARRGEQLSDSERGERALAQRNLGDVLAAQGHADTALHEYQEALNAALMLAAKEPANSSRQRDVSIAHDKVGDVRLVQGDAAGALAEYQASLAIAQALAARDPASTERQVELAVSHDRVGTVHVAQGDAAGALAEYRASLAIAVPLAARNPESAERQADVATSHNKVGDMLFAQGDVAGALSEYRASLAIANALTTRDPNNADHLADLAMTHNRIGDGRNVQGDTAGALAEYRAALSINQQLAAKDPTSADRQRALSNGRNSIGDVLLTRGELAGALTEFTAALGIDEALAAKDPTNADRQRALSTSHNNVGNVRIAQKDTAGALAEYRASLEIDRKLAALDPTNTDRQRDLSVSHYKVGDVRLAQGDATGAVTAYRASLAIREALAARDQTNADRQSDLAVIHEKLGDGLAASNEVSAALTEERTALAIRKSLSARDRSNADWQRALLVSHEKVGDLLRDQRESASANIEYQAALAIARDRSAKDPSDSAAREATVRLARKLAHPSGVRAK